MAPHQFLNLIVLLEIFCSCVESHNEFSASQALNHYLLPELLKVHEPSLDDNLRQDWSPELGNEDSFLSVPQLARKYGYPIEEHEVTTEDGYILTIHRIPYGKNFTQKANKPAVYLQHGFFMDSSAWILNKETTALAYVLANNGYDVWLGNIRGNTYSRKHTKLSVLDPDFWQFSLHELGVYDFPAILKYILVTAAQERLHFIGHSMGTTIFLIAMDKHPELNDKIILASLLAPVATLKYLVSAIWSIIASYIDEIKVAFELSGVYEMIPSSPFLYSTLQALCGINSPTQDICAQAIFAYGGPNPTQLDRELLPVIVGHVPSAACIYAFVHFIQVYNSGIFRQYDFGREKNLMLYGTSDPPEYDLSKVEAPVALYWSDNDWIATPQDVRELAGKLPNLARNYRVKLDLYAHHDFVWAVDNDKLLHPELINFIQEYSFKANLSDETRSLELGIIQENNL